MRLILAVLAVILVVGGIGAALDGGEDEQSSAPKAVATPLGNVEVYQRIAALTDCGALQKEFDTASENHKRDSERQRSDLMQIDTSYMNAADARMRSIGCYR